MIREKKRLIMENQNNNKIKIINSEMLVISAFYFYQPKLENKGLVNRIKNTLRIKETVDFMDIYYMTRIASFLTKKTKVYCEPNFNHILKFIRKDWRFSRQNAMVSTELSHNRIEEIFQSYPAEVKDTLLKAYKLNELLKKKQAEAETIKKDIKEKKNNNTKETLNTKAEAKEENNTNNNTHDEDKGMSL